MRYALDALAALGPPAVPRLIEALKYEKVRVAGGVHSGPDRSGRGAGHAGAGETGRATRNDRVAHEAILALAHIGPGAKAAVPALIQALQRSENPNACAIAYALGKIGPDAAAAEPVLFESAGQFRSQVGRWPAPGRWSRSEPASAEVAAKTVPVLMAGLTDDLPMARAGRRGIPGQPGACCQGSDSGPPESENRQGPDRSRRGHEGPSVDRRPRGAVEMGRRVRTISTSTLPTGRGRAVVVYCGCREQSPYRHVSPMPR